jgi:hypothetical protein
MDVLAQARRCCLPDAVRRDIGLWLKAQRVHQDPIRTLIKAPIIRAASSERVGAETSQRHIVDVLQADIGLLAQRFGTLEVENGALDVFVIYPQDWEVVPVPTSTAVAIEEV